MKKKITLLFLMIILFIGKGYAQQHFKNREKIANFSEFKNQLENFSPDKRTSKNKTGLVIKTGKNKSLPLQINLKKSNSDINYFVGEIVDVKNATFHFEEKQNKLSGIITILDKNKKQAFSYDTDNDGNIFVEEVDINAVLCVDFPKEPDNVQNREDSQIQQATPANVFNLQSYPTATGGVIYLDFDGEVVTGRWNGGQTINAAPAPMTNDEIYKAWQITSEDYVPFNVNVTTDLSIFNSYPKGKRTRVIITSSNSWYGSAGGVAYIGSFNWTDDTPAWAFTNGVGNGGKNIGEVCSHEAGHTLSLSHDGRTDPVESYYAGQLDWAPIMGVGYYKPITQWSKGEYLNANNKQDDLALIQNYVGFRADDVGNRMNIATPLVIATDGSVSSSQNAGVIEFFTDIDMFSFTTQGGDITLNIRGAAFTNLNIKALLTNASGTVIQTSDPQQPNYNGLLTYTNLPAGNYYVSVSGTGSDTPLTGYSNYGSLGSYTISGTIISSNQAPIVSITSPLNNASFTAPASITLNAMASDSDGTISKVEFYNGTTLLNTSTTSPYSYVWNNVPTGNYIITAKAYDNLNAVTTSSNIAILVNPLNICGNIPAWSTNTAYDTINTQVSYNGKIYKNKWWTIGEQPDLNIGVGKPWEFVSNCNISAITTDVTNENSQSTTTYPNPLLDNYLNIDLSTIGEELFTIELFSTNLAISVYHEQIKTQTAGAQTITIDLKSVPKGIYMLIISNNKKKESKLIIRK